VSNDLDPVSIRVINEGDVLLSVLSQQVKVKTHPHLALLGPLLELDTLLIEPLDGSFEVVNSHANMSEPFSNIIVSGSVSLEAVVLF
jgi:hypothetical protein